MHNQALATMNFLKSKEETFVNKALLIFIENVVFGILVLLIGLYFENQINRNEKERDLYLSVVRVHTDFVQSEREKISDAVDEFIFILRSLESGGKEASDEELEKLTSLAHNIQTRTRFLESAFPASFSDKTDNLIDSVNRARSDVAVKRTAEEIQQLQEKIMMNYITFLNASRKASIDALQEDLDSL